MIVAIVAGVVLLFGAVVFFGAPYVPSHSREVRRAFETLYPLARSDVVVDLGSGDGRVLREASRRQARAVGYELNPVLVVIARLLSLGDSRVRVATANFWRTPLPPDTTLVYMFGVSRDSTKLVKKLQRESDRLGRPLLLMTYGPALKTRQTTATYRAHCLYTFTPLQTT